MLLKQEKSNTILWDWNGTLLNDVRPSWGAMNELLSKRKRPLLALEKYKEIFDFPVIDYYRMLGFDFKQEVWEDVAAEFMSTYHNKEADFSLFQDALPALQFFKKNNYRQYILSAMKTSSIVKMLDHFKIASFFDGIYGLDNHYADGKIDLGRQLLNNENLLQEACLMIGDTVHDAKVAEALECQAVLISQGHQSFTRLKSTTHPTFHTLKELIDKAF